MKRGILVAFFGTRQVEVQNIMMMLYDEEYINRTHEEHLIIDTQAKTAKNLMRTLNLSAVQALQAMMVPEAEQDKYLKFLSLQCKCNSG